MGNRKALTAKNMARALPEYIRTCADEAHTQISVRLPSLLKKRFDAAQRSLQQHRLEMQLSEIIRFALVDACETAERAVANFAANPAVEDSSASGVEESGAIEEVEVSSTHAMAPPLKGSSEPQARSGVGLRAEER